MTKSSTITILLLIAAAAIVILQATGDASSEDHDEEPELAAAMESMQYYTHKLMLAIEADNSELAGFYLHELEELAEDVADDIPQYEGHQIGALVQSVLLPGIEALEDRLASGQRASIEDGLDNLIASCNACHASTAHGYIVIQRTDANPYMQDFSASP